MTNKLTLKDRSQIAYSLIQNCSAKHNGDKAYSNAYLISRLCNYLTDKQLLELLKEFQQ